MLPSLPAAPAASSPTPGTLPFASPPGISSGPGSASIPGQPHQDGSTHQDPGPPHAPLLQDHIKATDLEAAGVIGGATIDIDSHEKAFELLAVASRLVCRLQDPAPLFAAPNILDQHKLVATARSPPSSSAATILLHDAIARDKTLMFKYMGISLLTLGA